MNDLLTYPWRMLPRESLNRDLQYPLERRLQVRQSVVSGLPNSNPTRTLVLPQTPWFTLLAAGGYDGPHGLYSISHSGYEWYPGPSAGGTGSGYAQPALWFGKRTSSAPSTSVQTAAGAASGTGWAESCVLEIPGLLGEYLWTGMTWGTSTSMSVAAPKAGLWVPGALLVALSRFKSGGAGGLSATLTTGQTAFASYMGNLCQLWLYRYIPGSRPGVTFGFARSTASSGLLAIVR